MELGLHLKHSKQRSNAFILAFISQICTELDWARKMRAKPFFLITTMTLGLHFPKQNTEGTKSSIKLSDMLQIQIPQ